MLSIALAAFVTARLALVTVTAGYRHASIPVAEEVISEVARQTGSFAADFYRTEEDLLHFDPARYDVVMFVNTTGELPLNPDLLVQWVRDGGTFIGVHSAADTLHESDAYLEMLGGEFDFHGPETAAALWVEDATHPSTTSIETPFNLFEEYYHFKRFDPSKVHTVVALRFDPDANVPAMMPISWWRDVGRGRVFYTALGHREDVWRSEWFQSHLTGAIQWAIARPPSPPRRRAVRR